MSRFRFSTTNPMPRHLPSCQCTPEHNGVWVADGEPSWQGKYYLYSVKVWVPSDGAVDTNVTSDPYSVDIALNGAKSRITDLESDETKPAGWDEDTSPPLRSFSDLSLYELHIRDFSVNDLTVPSVIIATACMTPLTTSTPTA